MLNIIAKYINLYSFKYYSPNKILFNLIFDILKLISNFRCTYK